MERIVIKKILKDHEADALAGKFLTDITGYRIIKDTCDVYDNYGNPLVMFRKDIVDKVLLKQAWENYSESITLTDGRGVAAGEMFNRVRNDGSTSNIKISNKVLSGNVGYMDAGSMIHYCRQTQFAASNANKFKNGFPFIEHIDQLYKQVCPTYYASQKAIADATNRNYVIGDTCFTTVTVNKNFQTAIHKDSGDYPKGYGNIIVYDDGGYDGAFTCMPQYGIAVDVRAGDIMFCDVHQWHCNSPFIPLRPDYLRGTFVIYYREYMKLCKQPTEELQQLKIDKGGYNTI